MICGYNAMHVQARPFVEFALCPASSDGFGFAYLLQCDLIIRTLAKGTFRMQQHFFLGTPIHVPVHCCTSLC